MFMELHALLPPLMRWALRRPSALLRGGSGGVRLPCPRPPGTAAVRQGRPAAFQSPLAPASEVGSAAATLFSIPARLAEGVSCGVDGGVSGSGEAARKNRPYGGVAAPCIPVRHGKCTS